MPSTTRNIAVVSTTFSGMKKFDDATVNTVGELKALIASQVSLDKMNIAALQVATNEKHILQYDETTLPEGDLAVYLSPSQQKGA